MSSTVRASGALLWLRAALLATVALGAGTLAHLGADGLLPGPSALLVLLVCCTAAAAPLLRTQASTVRVVLLLVLGQAVVHGALTALAGHRDDLVLPATAALPMPRWMLHLTEDVTGPHAAMALAHAAAAAVVGLWLARGEHAVWTLVRLAGRSLALPGGPAALPVVAGPSRAVPTDHTLLPLPSRTLGRTLRRRGPPLPPAA